jgi:hypothetical protein
VPARHEGQALQFFNGLLTFCHTQQLPAMGSAAESQTLRATYMNSENIEPKPTRNARWLIVTALFLAAAAAVLLITFKVSQSVPRGEAVRKIAAMQTAVEQKDLAELIVTNYEEYRGNTVRWSATYFTCVFLSAAFSALAGFVLKVKMFAKLSVAKEDLAALLAMLAALLVTLSTAGDFQRKWQSNRIAAGETEALAYDLLKAPLSDGDRESMIASLKEISLHRNQGIVGDKVAPSLAKIGLKPMLK